MSEISSRTTPIDDSYATCERTEATLAIYNVDPELVSQKIGVSPTSIQKKGIPKIMPNGNLHIGTIDNWLLSSEDSVSSKDLRRHLDWVLDKIEPFTENLRELQELPDVKMTVRCVWWSSDGGGGPTLWPEQMIRMAKLNLEFTISFAYYGDNELES